MSTANPETRRRRWFTWHALFYLLLAVAIDETEITLRIGTTFMLHLGPCAPIALMLFVIGWLLGYLV